MKRATSELLCCPGCHAELRLCDEGSDETVEEGLLLCPTCEQRFPIEGGLPRFIRPEELEGLNRRFARFYDWLSHMYTLFTKVAFLPMGGERKARKEILDRLELNGGRVLEVSIGPGINLPYLFESPVVDDVYGLDISLGQLARCRRFVSKRGWSVDLFLGMAEALPFKAGSFDSVFHIGGINFFSGKKQAIEEMIRVARPGTKIVIADETERLARLYDRILGLSRSDQGTKADLAVPLNLVPDTMEETRVVDIWKAHGQFHGYCLEFRKPE
jgi:ubiquinone/menaquinone biosynthesis C-methylase UbiE